MRTISIPKTDLIASVVGIGVADQGTRLNEEESFRLFDLYAELGGNFYDTAHIYAAWIPGGWGMPERVLGAWVKSRGVRDQVIIGTKGGHPNFESMNVSRLSPEEILQDLDESLERLAMDTVDLYWLHRDDESRPVSEIADTLESAISAKKIRYFGVSNWSIARIQELTAYLSQQNRGGFAGSQVGWSLAQRNADIGGDPTLVFADEALLEYHRGANLFLAAYSSQANGFFGGGYGRDIPNPTPRSAGLVTRSYYNEINFARLERAEALAKQRQTTAHAIALAYLVNHAFPVCALASCPSESYLRATMAAGDLALSAEEVRWLADGDS